jgi:dTMP kinase
MRGRFISFEGGEGAGKSTQIKLLSDFLQSQGQTVIVTREPGGTEGAEAIRALLMTGSADKWNAQTEALLFAAARADHVAKKIVPALEAGQWVLCDRFIDSTRAYQGRGGVLNNHDIMALHRIGSLGILPDLTLLLKIPVEEGAARALARDAGMSDRMGSKGLEYYERVSAAFDQFAADEPDRFRVIDGHASVEAVHAQIVKCVEALL